MTRGLLAHNASRVVLVTGVTGFVGQALLHSLLTRFETTRVWVVLRPRKGVSAKARLEELLAGSLFCNLSARTVSRVKLVEWDLEQPRPMGVAFEEALHEGIDTVYHCAASVAFAASREENEASNVTSTLHLFAALEASGRPFHFVHVSTAYAFGRGGSPAQPLPEERLPALNAKSHANSYTLTKATAEERLLDACAHTQGCVKLAIVRPSIVFGAVDFPHAGWNPSFTASAGIVALVAKGALRWLPGRASAHVDHVPVDRLVNVLLLADEALARGDRGHSPAETKSSPLILHACAGPAHTLKWGEFAQFVLRAMSASPVRLGARPAFGFSPSRMWVRLRTALLLRWPGQLLSAVPSSLPRVKHFGFSLLKAAQCHEQVGQLFAPFTNEDWVFASSRARELHAALPSEERHAFPVGCEGVEWSAYVATCYESIAKELRSRVRA